MKKMLDIKAIRERAEQRYEEARKELAAAKVELKVIKKEEKRLVREQRKAVNAVARYEQFRETQKQRRNLGLCVKCGKKAIPSKRTRGKRWTKLCPKHHALELTAQRRRRGVKRPRISLAE